MSASATINRRRIAGLAAGLLLAASAGLAAAAEGHWPSKPISLVVRYPPGGTDDNVARPIAEQVAAKAGQPVIIEYKPGAGGTIGAQFVARAKPDGYTPLDASIGDLAIAPQLMPVQFDTFKSFQSIAYIGSGITTFAVGPDLPAKNLQELVAHAKKHPITLGPSGVAKDIFVTRQPVARAK